MKTATLSATLRRYGVSESLTSHAGKALIEAANKLERQEALLRDALPLLDEAQERITEGVFRGTTKIVVNRIRTELDLSID
jgi:hypothetical protein